MASPIPWESQHHVDQTESNIADATISKIEHLVWTFAIILRPADVERIPEVHATREFGFKDFVLNTCVKIACAGLEIQIVPRTETSKHKVILLVRLPEQRFMEEYRKLVLRRWKQSGEGVTFRPVVDADGDGLDDQDGMAGHGATGGGLREILNPTEADRIQLTAMLLSKQQERGGCGFGNIEHLEQDANKDPRVVSIFPLHNQEWNRQVTAQWKKAFSLKARAKQFHAGARFMIEKVCAAVKTCRIYNVQVTPEPGDVLCEIDDPPLKKHVVVDPEDLEELEERERVHLRAAQLSAIQELRSAGGAGNASCRSFVNNESRRKLVKRSVKPRSVTSEHEKFLTNVKQQYGERFAFLFAFNTACAESIAVLIYITVGLWLIQVFGSASSRTQSFWEFYLRLSGVVGLLIPCVWGPAFLSRWDRMAYWYSNIWGSIGVTSIPAPSPFYKAKPPDRSDVFWVMKTVAAVLLSISAVVIAVLAMFGMNIAIMELEILVQNAPLCGSWFYESVWKDYIAAGGKHTSTKTNSFGHIANLVPSCYGGFSEDPWGIHTASEWPGSGAWLWRGLMVVIVAAVEGIMIGVVYTEIFTCLALKLAHMLNKPLWQEHEATVINFTYPFECFAFMAYFWVLAFIFIPASTKFQAWLAENEHPLVISFNGTINVTTTASTMVELWMHDKRYKNQIGPMILPPVLVGVNIPMIFEYLLPAMCVSWQRANRQSEKDREGEERAMPKCRPFLQCWRCCCTSRCCWSIFRACRCCILMCNCCMCDHDRGITSERPQPALPDDYSDEMLARDATDAIRKFGHQKHLPMLQSQEVICHTLQRTRNTPERGSQPGDEMIACPTVDAHHQLHKADDIIVESMLDPLDLPNEYRKISIVSLLVCMFTQVNLLVPLIGWFSLLTRFKFNFIRLAKYTRRPVPHTPNTSDSTGGYRPWLEAQILLSTVVTNLLFCCSTGQLEAWWVLYDREACQPPTLERTVWKYPQCDTTFLSEGTVYDSTDKLYDEMSSEQAVEKVDPWIMASNATCWQTGMPQLDIDCPFVHGITDEWRATSERSSTQSLHRLICFVILQNLQVMLLYAMMKWNRSKDGGIQEKWKAVRLAQHSLVADQIFPPDASDQIYSVVEATLARRRLKHYMEHMHVAVPDDLGNTFALDRMRARMSVASDDSFVQNDKQDAPHRQATKMGRSASITKLVAQVNVQAEEPGA